MTINIKKILLMTKSGLEKDHGDTHVHHPRSIRPLVLFLGSPELLGDAGMLLYCGDRGDRERLVDILHGRPDERVVKALDILRAAMTDQGRLLVIDCLQPRPGHESAAGQAQVLDDLNALVRSGGHGGQELELRELAATAGV